MRVNISCGLLALFLGFNVTAVMSRGFSFSMPRVRLPAFKPPPPVYVPRLPEYNFRIPEYNFRLPEIKPPPPVYVPRLPEYNFRIPEYNFRPPASNPHLPGIKPRPPASNPHLPGIKPRPPASNPHLPGIKPRPPASNPHLPEIKPRPPASKRRFPEIDPDLLELLLSLPAPDPNPPASNHNPPASNPNRPASNPNPPASNRNPPASNRNRPASNSNPPASNPNPPASNPNPPASNPNPPASNPNPPASNPNPPASNPNPPASNPNPPASNPPAFTLRPPVFHRPRLADKQSIQRVLADPDRFLCYRESAVQLPAIQPGECQKPFDQNMSIILSCPLAVEGNVTWSRETNGSKVDILTADGDEGKADIHDLDGRYSLLANKSLLILRAAVSDAGRYFCNSEAAGELTVMNSDAPKHHKHHDLMDEVSTFNYGILVAALFATAFIVVLVLSVWYRYIKQGNNGKRHVHDEIQDGLECQPRNECSA